MSAWKECDEKGCDEPADFFVPREKGYFCRVHK